jgi:hypothetical protein
MKYKGLLLLILVVLALEGMAQQVPVSFPVLRDYLRRQQVLGTIDSKHSFHYLPIQMPQVMGKGADPFLRDSLQFQREPISREKHQVRFSVLPVQLTQTYNSALRYGWGDGAMVPARGIQHLLSAGVHLGYKGLSVQLYPQFHYAQNLPFEEYDPNLPIGFYSRKSRYVNFLDNPVRYGTGSFTQLLPGNSHVKYNLGSFAAGVSTENIWWGPGKNHGLMYSDNAEGFLHATLHTTKPIETFLGNFEGQYFMGRLEGSGLTQYSDGAYQNLYRDYIDDWRYLTGLSVTYSPKWIDGLHLGVARSFMMYSENRNEQGFTGWFPLFEGFQKEQIGIRESTEAKTDQLVSVFARWVFEPAKAEVYGEFIRTDHPLNWRDLIINPEHSRGYLLGFTKYIPLKSDVLVEVGMEMTQTENSINSMLRWAGTGLTHGGLGLYDNYQVRHGMTNRGQILGSGLGNSGNQAVFSASRVKGMKKIGVSFERLAHDNIVHNYIQASEMDILRWVTLGMGAHWEHSMSNLLFSVDAKAMRSHNVNWSIRETNSLGDFGKSQFNFHSRIKAAYVF